MKRRTLDALKNLAERPGTEAEGKLAKEILDRYRDSRFLDQPEKERPMWQAFEDYQSGSITLEEFLEAIARRVRQETAHLP